MKPKGIIYQSGISSRVHGEIILKIPKYLRGIYFFLRGVGIGLIILGIYLPASSYGSMIFSEFRYYYSSILNNNNKQIDYSIEAKDNNNVVEVQAEAESIGVNTQFSIFIPKIEAKSDVIANVDAGNKKEYEIALSKGVAHARGTGLPGQNSRIFLFSHSTDSPLNFSKYNAIFYLLRHMEKDDQIIVYFADKKYEYKVKETKIVSPYDTSWFEPEANFEQLVLMTCDPPGTSLRRLIVVAEPV